MIETDNGFRIPHVDIEAAHAANALTISGPIPDCQARLMVAIPNSHRLTGRKKRELQEWIK